MGRTALLGLLRSRSNHLQSTLLNSPVTRYRRIPRPEPAAIFAQRRWASNGGGKISIGPNKDEVADEDAGMVVYHGAISSTIKKVKILSLSTCCLSVSLGPVVTFLTNPASNVILKGAVASSVIFLSATTTAALHWFVSPYVHKLRWRPGSEEFEVEMLSWLASPLSRTISFSEIRYPDTSRPYVTFQAGKDFYFIDGERCHNKALLARLTPQKPPTHPSAFKNL